jgi:hypothetical protein
MIPLAASAHTGLSCDAIVEVTTPSSIPPTGPTVSTTTAITRARPSTTGETMAGSELATSIAVAARVNAAITRRGAAGPATSFDIPVMRAVWHRCVSPWVNSLYEGGRDKGVPMKYMLLIHGNREGWSALTEEDGARIHSAHSALIHDLTESGELISTNEFDLDTAKIMRTEAGRPVVTDGPFVEVKEILAGYYLVDVADQDRALDIAARLAEGDFSLTEVRRLVH